MPASNLVLYAIWEDIPAVTYSVIVINGTGSGDHAVGTTVLITAETPPEGQKFKNWTTTSNGVDFSNANSASTNFVMPANAVAVTANFETITGSHEITDFPLVHVYPNPTEGIFTLDFEVDGVYNLTISDMSGKILLRETVSGQTVQMDISNYSAGVYLLTINNGKGQTTKRIVKD